jgi:ferredoxin--NADP+ reductase
MAKNLEYNATVVERVDLTTALAIFKVRPDREAADPGPFLPGQYLTLGLNNEVKPELGSVRRPMSIVSAPEEGDVFEFYIRYVSEPESDNPLTHLLWKIRTDDRMFLRSKAAGTFTLKHTIGENDGRLKICVAAGTGLAPFVSMVRSKILRDPQARLDDFVILHGASYPQDIGYRHELESLRARGLHYFPTVSRPQEAAAWQEARGRVEDFFLPGRLADLEAKIGLAPGELRPDKAAIFICGLQGTIGQTVIRLLERGFVPENRKLKKALEVPEDIHASLFFEQYDTTPVIPIDDEDLMAGYRATLHQALKA